MSPGDGATEAEDCGCDTLAEQGVQTFAWDAAKHWRSPKSGQFVDMPGTALGRLLGVLDNGGVEVRPESRASAIEYATKLDTAIESGDWDTVFRITPDFYDATGDLYVDYLENATGTDAYIAASDAYDALEQTIMDASEASDAVFMGNVAPGDEPDGDGHAFGDPDSALDIAPTVAVDTGDDGIDEGVLDGDLSPAEASAVAALRSVVAEMMDAEDLAEFDYLMNRFFVSKDPTARPVLLSTLAALRQTLANTESLGVVETMIEVVNAHPFSTAAESFATRREAWAARLLDAYRAPDYIGASEKPGNDDNWVDRTGGLPSYIKRIANHLIEQGMSTSHAIASAVNTVKRWARGGGKVKPDTVAKAAAALAEWEAKKAAAKALAAELTTWAASVWDEAEKLGEFRDVSTEEREKLAEDGNALPDGSYPIANVSDLKNAIQAIGRAKDPAKAKAHIRKRARELGQESLIPDTWSGSTEEFAEAAPTDTATEVVDGITAVSSAVLSVANDVAELFGLIPEGTRESHGHTLASDLEAVEEVTRALAATSRTAVATALIASPGAIALEVSAPIEPPKAWFDNPGFSAATPITVTPEGHVYGHLATWDACHMESAGMGTSCMRAPRSYSDYALFHTGYVRTAEGVDVPTGRLVADAPHADPAWDLPSTLVHYSHSGRAVADVRVGEDAYGIWVSGAMRPDVSKAQMRVLRASPLSGDWRMDPRTRRLELVTGLAVNVPGFMPKPRALVASAGSVLSMQAVGLVPPKQIAVRDGKPVLPREDLAYLKERSAAIKSWTIDADMLATLARRAVELDITNFAHARMIEEMEAIASDMKELRDGR